jgi:hypothetical protein
MTTQPAALATYGKRTFKQQSFVEKAGVCAPKYQTLGRTVKTDSISGVGHAGYLPTTKSTASTAKRFASLSWSLCTHPDAAVQALDVLSIARNLERVANYATNIAGV